MKKRKYLNRFVVFFFAFMLFFTLFSASIRKQTVPTVAVARLRERTFPVTVTLEDGGQYVSSKRELGVPVAALDFLGTGGTARVFVLEETEEGYFVRERSVEVGEMAEGWYEVKEGLQKRDLVVYAMDRGLVDGMMVQVWEK